MKKAFSKKNVAKGDLYFVGWESDYGSGVKLCTPSRRNALKAANKHHKLMGGTDFATVVVVHKLAKSGNFEFLDRVSSRMSSGTI